MFCFFTVKNNNEIKRKVSKMTLSLSCLVTLYKEWVGGVCCTRCKTYKGTGIDMNMFVLFFFCFFYFFFKFKKLVGFRYVCFFSSSFFLLNNIYNHPGSTMLCTITKNKQMPKQGLRGRGGFVITESSKTYEKSFY